MVDTTGVRIRASTTDLLAAEFARAVAAGDHARAEGWLATALLVRDRDAARRPKHRLHLARPWAR